MAQQDAHRHYGEAQSCQALSRRKSSNDCRITSNGRARGDASQDVIWCVNRDAVRKLVDAAERLFTPCTKCHKLHHGSRDSHVSFLNVDDPFGQAYCHFCCPDASAARVLQIRRNTYHDGTPRLTWPMLEMGWDVSGALAA